MAANRLRSPSGGCAGRDLVPRVPGAIFGRDGSGPIPALRRGDAGIRVALSGSALRQLCQNLCSPLVVPTASKVGDFICWSVWQTSGVVVQSVQGLSLCVEPWSKTDIRGLFKDSFNMVHLDAGWIWTPADRSWPRSATCTRTQQSDPAVFWPQCLGLARSYHAAYAPLSSTLVARVGGR